MDILIHMREIKIIASDMLPRLNYSKNAFAATHPVGSLITTSWIWLGHITASRKGIERKRKEEPMESAALSQPLNPGGLDHST